MARVVTGVVRLSYEHIWEPTSINGSNPKYTAQLIIDKDDTETVTNIMSAIDQAVEEGLEKFNGRFPDRNSLRLPLRDGDVEKDNPNYRNSYFLNAKSDSAPGVVDKNVQKIMDRGEVYSGCYVRVSLNFYAYNVRGNKGVAVGLGNIMKVKDGPSLGGPRSASEDFAAFKPSGSFLD